MLKPSRLHKYQFFLCLLILGQANEVRSLISPPSWESGWLSLRSQQGQDSFLEVYHGLNEIPLKGKALVRPKSGPNKDFMFEAVGSAQWDDDFGRYCGVVFMYNDQHARLWAPSVDNSNDQAWAFCAGMEGWTTGPDDAFTQVEHDVEVKILLWLSADYPTPDVLIDWTPVSCADPLNVYREFANPLNEELGLLILQVKVVGTGSTTWVSEGIGSANFDSREDSESGSYTNQGGVIFAHSDHDIRLWIRYPKPSDTKNVLTYVGDGWAGTYKYVREGSGEVRLSGWKQPADLLFHYTFDADLDTQQFHEEVLLQPKLWNPLTAQISVQVTPLDGENGDYTFYAMGIMPREPYQDNHYGGIQFGYTQAVARLFFPTRNSTACLASITESWGYQPGTHQQCARRARVNLKIWGQPPQIAGYQDLFCSVTTYGTQGTLTDSIVNLCMKKCMLFPGPDCLAVKMSHSDQLCQTLDVELANEAMVSLNLANELLIFPRSCLHNTT